MSERIFIRCEERIGDDFTGAREKRFGAAASQFTSCNFSKVRWSDCTWGEGKVPTVYRDCIFDGAQLQARVPGAARFERCSFRDVKLRNWNCDGLEFVDCVFTGNLHTIVFNGSPPEPYRSSLGRHHNEFVGNDFSGARFTDVGFRGGIDLTLQRLPRQDNLLLVHDAVQAVARAEGLINVWNDLENRARAQGLLRFLRRLTDSGQRQLLLEADDLEKVFGTAVWDRVQRALRPDQGGR